MICWQRLIIELDKDNYAVRARADAKMMMPSKCAQHVTYRCARARLAWRVCRQYMLVSDNKCLCVCWRRSAAFLSHTAISHPKLSRLSSILSQAPERNTSIRSIQNRFARYPLSTGV